MATTVEEWMERGRGHLVCNQYAPTAFERYRPVVRRFLAFLGRKRVEITTARAIRQTKFFKSRRLPLRPTVIAALATYLEARRRAGCSTDAAASLFGYA